MGPLALSPPMCSQFRPLTRLHGERLSDLPPCATHSSLSPPSLCSCAFSVEKQRNLPTAATVSYLHTTSPVHAAWPCPSCPVSLCGAGACSTSKQTGGKA